MTDFDLGSGGDRPIGLLTAIPEEITHLAPAFAAVEVSEMAGFTFRHGVLEGRPVVLVEAGVGKVNAAVTATLLLNVFHCRALIFSGVAGGLDPALPLGDIVIASRVVQYDYGALIDGRIKTYQPGVLPLPGLESAFGYNVPPARLQRAKLAVTGIDLPTVTRPDGGARVPGLHFGTVLTGDAFVACSVTRRRLSAEFAALAVEMEGAAVAQVAERYGVPWLVVRALSDLAGESSSVDFPTFMEETASGAAVVVRRLTLAFED